MPVYADRLIAYCISIAQEFQSRLNRMQVFVKHNLSTGTANEVILREFLSTHAPGDFNVGQGFMCDPFEENKVSKQCDILIYNQASYPVVYADGSIKVIWPEATRMVIEVKTNFTKDDIHTSIENISSAMKLGEHIYGVVFAFQSPRLQTVLKHLKEYPAEVANAHKPTAILLLDKGVIIHRWGWTRQRDIAGNPDADQSAYSVRKAKSEQSAIVVAFLLLLFFENLGRNRGLYGTDAINAAMKMLENHTERLTDVRLGATE